MYGPNFGPQIFVSGARSPGPTQTLSPDPAELRQ